MYLNDFLNVHQSYDPLKHPLVCVPAAGAFFIEKHAPGFGEHVPLDDIVVVLPQL